MGQKCTGVQQNWPLQIAVCRSRRARAMNKVEQEAFQDSAEENSIDSVSINSIYFNKNCSILTVNLKKCLQVQIISWYHITVDTGSDGNIMPLHKFKKVFPQITSEQLVATKNNKYSIKNV